MEMGYGATKNQKALNFNPMLQINLLVDFWLVWLVLFSIVFQSMYFLVLIVLQLLLPHPLVVFQLKFSCFFC